MYLLLNRIEKCRVLKCLLPAYDPLCSDCIRRFGKFYGGDDFENCLFAPRESFKVTQLALPSGQFSALSYSKSCGKRDTVTDSAVQSQKSSSFSLALRTWTVVILSNQDKTHAKLQDQCKQLYSSGET